MKIVEMPLSQIRRYANNPRNNERTCHRIAASIKDFGFTNPLILDRDGVIICGDTRYLAALKLALPTVPCIVRDDLTEDQATALRVVDNKVAELAEWDKEKLKAELAAIGGSIDMEALGFDVPTINDLEDDVYEGTETEPETVTKPGCIWHLGKHRLMCGDSTKEADVSRLMDGATASLCVTDPPYNVDYEGASCTDKIANDNLGDGFPAFMLDCMRSLVNHTRGPAFVFMSSSELSALYNGFTMAGGHFGFFGIWKKTHFTLGRSDYQRKYEPYLYGWAGDERPEPPKKMTDLMVCRKPNKSALHSTMKPVPLFEEIIRENSRKGDVVLDLFGGSGTTLVAAEKQHRTAYAMEFSPVFCDRIVERFRSDFGVDAYMEEPETEGQKNG